MSSINNKLFIGLLVLAAGVLAGWYFLSGNSQLKMSGQDTGPTPTQSTSNLGAPDSATGSQELMEKGGTNERTVVTYTDSGFAPSTVTVKVGSTVTFVNESDNSMWVASAPHPTHTIYPEFDALKGFEKGESYEFTFTKVGTWKYHDHLNPKAFGTIVVTK